MAKQEGSFKLKRNYGIILLMLPLFGAASADDQAIIDRAEIKIKEVTDWLNANPDMFRNFKSFQGGLDKAIKDAQDALQAFKTATPPRDTFKLNKAVHKDLLEAKERYSRFISYYDSAEWLIKGVDIWLTDNAKFANKQVGIDLKNAQAEAENVFEKFKKDFFSAINTQQLEDDVNAKIYDLEKRMIAANHATKLIDAANAKIASADTWLTSNAKLASKQVGDLKDAVDEVKNAKNEYEQQNSQDSEDKLKQVLHKVDGALAKAQAEPARIAQVIAAANAKLSSVDTWFTSNAKLASKPVGIDLKDAKGKAKNAVDEYEKQSSQANEDKLQQTLTEMDGALAKAQAEADRKVKGSCTDKVCNFVKSPFGVGSIIAALGLGGGWVGGSRYPMWTPDLVIEPKTSPKTTDDRSSQKPGSGSLWWVYVLVIVALIVIGAGAAWFFYYREQTKTDGGSKTLDGGEKGEGSKKSTSATPRSSSTKATDTASSGQASSGQTQGSSTGQATKTSS